MKESVVEVDGEDVPARTVEMPIRSWSYRTQDPAVRHLGPTAQDFHAAFGLGRSERRITTIDISGVDIRAVQALEERPDGTPWPPSTFLRPPGSAR